MGEHDWQITYEMGFREGLRFGMQGSIPKEEVRQFIENIQKIKDNHNEYGEPINYGTICGILIEGYRLLDKYRKGEDGKND